MDIGPEIETITVEPLEDPVPRQDPAPAEAPGVEIECEPELVPAGNLLIPPGRAREQVLTAATGVSS